MIDIRSTMRGVQLVGHGDVDKLVYRDDLVVPKPGPRDVLIRVGAAGVNNTDLNTRIGWYSKSGGDAEDAGWGGNALCFPRIQGADVCGRIVAVGDQVDDQRVGERVLVEPVIREANGEQLAKSWYLGSECDGGFADYLVVAARQAHPISSTLSDLELASFPCSYSTAENLLTRANVDVADRVLVTGASGGVGSAAVQLARARGARVIGVTSPSKAARVLSLGAEQTVARDADLIEALGKDCVDVVIDLVGGPNWPDLLDVLKPYGRYAVSGAIAGPLVELDLRTLYLKDLTLFGCTIFKQGIFEQLIARIQANDIRPLVAKTFALDQIPRAQTEFARKRHVGKLVIDLGIGRG